MGVPLMQRQILQGKQGVKFYVPVICDLLTYQPCAAHSCVHTTESLCANIQPWKSPCVEDFTTGFMETI